MRAANLMRPAIYDAYHHITVMGAEDAPADHVYSVVGGLCENNDQFARDRALPKVYIGTCSLFTIPGHMVFRWI